MSLDDFERRAVGFRIRALRQNNGMSESSFARILNESRSKVNLIETGQHRLFMDEAVRIAEIFNVSMQDICRDLQRSGRKFSPDPKTKLLNQSELERLIAVELGKLRPGVLDRVLRMTGELRAARRTTDGRAAATSKILDEIRELYDSVNDYKEPDGHSDNAQESNIACD